MQKIAKICEENSIFYSVHTKSSILTKSLNYSLLNYHSENLKKPEEKRTCIHVIPNLYEYILTNTREKYLKVSIQDVDEAIFKGIMKKLNKIKGVEVLSVVHSPKKNIVIEGKEVELDYFYTEITCKNVNKWTSIKKLIKKLHIKPKEVISIGDNINDKEMIQNSGMGVVMGNSAPYMKEIGNLVVADNNENGVAEAINKLILQ